MYWCVTIQVCRTPTFCSFSEMKTSLTVQKSSIAWSAQKYLTFQQTQNSLTSSLDAIFTAHAEASTPTRRACKVKASRGVAPSPSQSHSPVERSSATYRTLCIVADLPPRVGALTQWGFAGGKTFKWIIVGLYHTIHSYLLSTMRTLMWKSFIACRQLNIYTNISQKETTE